MSHSYDDKYLLAEYLTTSAIASSLNVFSYVGISPESLATMVEWSKTRTVTLRFQGSHSCAFLRKAKRVVEDSSETVRKTTFMGISTSSSTKRSYTVKEWFWNFSNSYELVAYQGNMPERPLSLRQGQGATELTTTSKGSPYSAVSPIGTHELDLTWLLQQLSDNAISFRINRSDSACHTPRRNPQTESALRWFSQLRNFFQAVEAYFVQSLFPIQPNLQTLQMNAFEPSSLLHPVFPLFEQRPEDAGDAQSSPPPPSSSSSSSSSSPSSAVTLAATSMREHSSSVILSLGDLDGLLRGQRLSIEQKFAELAPLFPSTGLVTLPAVQLVLLARHALEMTLDYRTGVNSIEKMLWSQLVAAIGKEVGPSDFFDYMKFHTHKLFRARFQPRPFSYAVRRPGRDPEGMLTIQAASGDASLPEPLMTCVRSVAPAHAMRFSLDAATRVTFRGERYLHSWINHSFSGSAATPISLHARARQFSSFVLLVGRISSASTFEPTGAIILQNKDELIIPLLLEQIPTPKEFRDAIESLSPEQQAFCKAFRQMQLESTLFAVLVVQIKPQLEKLLGLPAHSLTKEIRLTQDLLELFIKYQIPSDLISFDGASDAAPATKVAVVKEYVQRMQQMIQSKKATELHAAAEEAVYAALPYASLESSGHIAAFDGISLGYASLSAPSSSSSSSSSYRSGAVGGRSSSRAPAPPTTDSRAIVQKPTAVAPPKNASAPASTSSTGVAESVDEDEDPDVFDFTTIPHVLDARFAQLDTDNALRPTIIKPDFSAWSKRSQASLLTSPASTTLYESQQKVEKNKAFDLLDALSRSGSLDVDDAFLHVFIAATHCFDKSLMDTIILDNVNPIEKVQRSLLIVSQTIHDAPLQSLIKSDQLESVQESSPGLFSQ